MKRLLLIGLGMLLWVSMAGPLSTYDPERAIVVVKMPDKVSSNPYQQEYEKMLYPTMRISTATGTGSGVIISHDTKIPPSPFDKGGERGIYILTAAHVVDNQSVVDIELYDSTIITGTVVITDTTKDLALLCASAVKTYSATLAPRDYTPYLFTPVYTIGCSLGLAPRPSAGIITAIDKDHWEVSSPILPGNSGGPVFDGRTYEVIGIAVWVRVYNGQLITTMAGVVPIDEIYDFLDSVKNTSKGQE